jgi:hypothetical protein
MADLLKLADELSNLSLGPSSQRRTVCYGNHGNIQQFRPPRSSSYSQSILECIQTRHDIFRRVRSDNELLVNFDDQRNEHALLIGWHDYMMAVGLMPIEAQVFRV